MVTQRWQVRSPADDVTLVEVVVRNSATAARRVRVRNRLDGPVWPPRREGVPEAGWTGDGFEGTVDAGGRLALGYATPAPPADPPVSVAAEPVTPDESLRPPGGAGLDPADLHVDVDPSAAGAMRALGDPRPPRSAVPTPVPAVPDAVATWFDGLEARIERARTTGDADLRDDRDALRAVRRRSTVLLERVEAVGNRGPPSS